MEFKFSSDLDDLVNRLNALGKNQLPFALSKAINNIIVGMRETEMAIMPAELENPTPFTMKAVKFTKSTKQNLLGVVYLDSIQDEYLKYQIEGGVRTPKRKAIAIPTKRSGKTIKNTFGNIPKGKIQKLIDNKKKYFVGKPTDNAPDGIYERVGKKGFKMILVWGRKAEYKGDKFDFYGHGERYLKQQANREVERAIQYAIDTATR